MIDYFCDWCQRIHRGLRHATVIMPSDDRLTAEQLRSQARFFCVSNVVAGDGVFRLTFSGYKRRVNALELVENAAKVEE